MNWGWTSENDCGFLAEFPAEPSDRRLLIVDKEVRLVKIALPAFASGRTSATCSERKYMSSRSANRCGKSRLELCGGQGQR